MSTTELGWDDAVSDAERELQGGQLKLEPGQSMTLVFVRDRPITKEAIHFVNNDEGKREPKDCEGQGCALCAQAEQSGNRDDRRAVSYELPVWRVSDAFKAPTIESWKVSRTVMKNVGEHIKRYSPTHVFEVRRDGAGTNTKYNLFPLSPLSDADLAAFQSVCAGQAAPPAQTEQARDEGEDEGF